MNIIILVSLTLIYIALTVAISLKLRDILKHPEKYEELELENRAYKRMRERKHFAFFQSLSHQYSFVTILFWIAICILSAALIYGILRLIAWDNELIFPGTALIGVIGMMFTGITVGMVIIPLHIKTTFFAVAVDGMFDGERYDIWKKAYISLLIFFALTFPFFILSSNNYIYYNDIGITSSAYFQLGEIYTAYEDIEEVRIYAHHDNDGDASALKYEIKLSDGKILDICTNNYFNERTLDVHKKIEAQSDCKVNIEPLTDEDIAYLTKKLSKEKMEIVSYIFEGLH